MLPRAVAVLLLTSAGAGALAAQEPVRMTPIRRSGTEVMARLAVPALPTAIAPSRIWPGMGVTVTGTQLSAATSVQIQVGCILASDGSTSCGQPSTTVTATPIIPNDGTLTFTVPAIPNIGDGAPIIVTLISAAGGGRVPGTISLDARPFFTPPAAPFPAGGQLLVWGRNLHRVTKAHFGSAPVGSPQNIVLNGTPSPDGLSVRFDVPAACHRTANLVLEETPGPGTWPSTQLRPAPSYPQPTAPGTPVTCTGGIEITSMTPAAGPPGTVVTYQGSGFNSLTEVIVGGAPSAGWTRQSDNTMTVVIPPKQSTTSSVNQLYYAFKIGTTGAGYLTPAPRVLTPPTLGYQPSTRYLNPEDQAVWPGQTIYLGGYGLSDPQYLHPVARIGKTVLGITGMTSTQLQLTAPAMPADLRGPITLEHEGGVATTQTVYHVIGPTVQIDGIDRKEVAAGDMVTLFGSNTFRIYGICRNGALDHFFNPVAEPWREWTAKSLKFVVPKTWSGSQVQLQIAVLAGPQGGMTCETTPHLLEVR